MSCKTHNMDLSFEVRDYSPQGFVGGPKLTLTHGLQPSGLISIVTKGDEWTELNIRDEHDNRLLYLVHRVDKNEFGLNTQINKTWGEEERITPVPMQKGVRTVTTVVYEVEGYKIIVNGKEIAFFKHRSTNKPQLLVIPWYCQVFKIVYLTPKTILS